MTQMSIPSDASAVLVLSSGHVFWGKGLGAKTKKVGELCFNTSLTGYQEILTDPSYAQQLITFTFPHVGNVGTNEEDNEIGSPFALGAVLRADITNPSNWRSAQELSAWLSSRDQVAIAGVDTRTLTQIVREESAPTAVLVNFEGSEAPDVDALIADAKAWPGLKGMDLAKQVSTRQTYAWDETAWTLGEGYGSLAAPKRHVVAVDFGAKRNILRCLAATGSRVTVVPATTEASDILAHKPDGVFLSNGPGDPAATGVYAVEMVKALLAADVPIFGICLGHQILAQALGGSTRKMPQGHRGGNHPVKDLTTGKVEITSQNHGFVVDEASLPDDVAVTHISLFDGSNEGIESKVEMLLACNTTPKRLQVRKIATICLTALPIGLTPICKALAGAGSDPACLAPHDARLMSQCH